MKRARDAGVDWVPRLRDQRPGRRRAARQPQRLEDAVEHWIAERAIGNRANHKNEVAHLRNHLLPMLGGVPLSALRPKDIRSWLRSLESKPPARGKGPTSGRIPQEQRTLAPRTIRKIYGTVHKLFQDFVADELLPSSPCRIKREDLPPDIDRDPEWRDGAVYSSAEVEALIFDDRVPEHRRVYYALAFLAGLRHGEVAGLRMRNIVADAVPLQKLLVPFSYGGRTKTLATRKVPIHPTLTAILAEWKLGGFQRWTGRHLTPDDLIMPGPVPRSRAPERGDADRMTTRHVAYKRLVNCDLPALGFRHRRNHDARRTFISLGRKGGADKDALKDITHAPSRQVFDMYTSYDWETKCEAVLCIKVGRSSSREQTRDLIRG